MPATNPLRAGLQVGLLGAASGMGFSALRRGITGVKPGAGGVTRDMLLGALIGASLGAYSANKASKSVQLPPMQSFDDVGDHIQDRIYKSSMDKQSLAISLPLIFGLMGAAGSLYSGTKAVGAARKGNWRGAAGHGAAAVGEGLMALMGAGPLLRAGRGLQMAARGMRAGRLANVLSKSPTLARAAGATGKAVAHGAGRMRGLENLIWRSKAKTVPGRIGGFMQGSVLEQLPTSVGNALLRPKPKAPASAARMVLDSFVDAPAARPQFRTRV